MDRLTAGDMKGLLPSTAAPLGVEGQKEKGVRRLK